MSYDLSILGWKAFQDLCCAVTAEVLQRPVQIFLPSKDGGRDGAFVGSWIDAGGATLKSTIQCKFMGKAGATLTLAALKEELPKVAQLVQQGLAEDYVILTNAGVSGQADAEICAAFEKVGVKTCRIYGGDWLVEQIKTRPRLRMLAPRVYGVGDLSHIATELAQTQAKAILDNMGPDLSCFVPTAAHRQAVESLNQFGFVILLGDPASGKSTIAALLALGALDQGCSGAVRISNPDQLSLWHPGEKQVLWVDDAFGSNQFDIARMSRWNAELGVLRTAVEAGSPVIFTSRNCIWAAARPILKVGDFPLLTESQVVVDVQALTKAEREQMLYNHVRRKQPQSMRTKLRPFLEGVADNPKFLPETARRLGDPLFTRKLTINAFSLQRLVDHPIEFLIEVLEQLDDANRAAIALIFLHPDSGVPSPPVASSALETVTRLTGATPAAITKALEHLNDSLTRLVSYDEGERWVFRHPTVTDAFAAIVGKSPGLVELYVHGARLERLVREVVCSAAQIAGAAVRVPVSLYGVVQARLATAELDETLKVFLGQRCDRVFLQGFVAVRPDVLDWAQAATITSLSQGGRLLIAALHDAQLLPEARRLEIVERLVENAVEWVQTEVFEDKALRGLFTPGEWAALSKTFQAEWVNDLEEAFDTFRGRFSSSDELGLYTDYKDNMERAKRVFGTANNEEAFDMLFLHIDEHIRSIEEDLPASPHSDWTPSVAIASEGEGGDASIFDDIDAA